MLRFLQKRLSFWTIPHQVWTMGEHGPHLRRFEVWWGTPRRLLFFLTPVLFCANYGRRPTRRRQQHCEFAMPAPRCRRSKHGMPKRQLSTSTIAYTRRFETSPLLVWGNL